MDGKMGGSAGLISEAEYLEFVRTGTGAVFRKVYDQYVGLIQFIAAKYLSDQGDIDDVVQETFTRFFHQRLRINKIAAIKSWLASTVRNLAIDLIRSRKNRSVDLASVPEVAADPDILKAELSIVVVRETLNELAALGKAKELKLFYVDGLKVAAIAAQLGVSTSTVTTNLTRQRRKFTDLLKQRLSEFTDS